LPYFDHIHRFLPALTRRQGGEVISHEVSHRNRVSGVSKYSNWQRFRVGLIDLLGVSWLIRRSSFPIKFNVENKEK
jgi:dolichol-phosphate mannosyltransferase